MELLAPAGNYEALIGAVNAGCDAVYLGGTKYGARAYAENFSDEEIIRGISYAHLFGVKVYLTVNTLIKESEFEDTLSYISRFYESGLDACIVQDLGLISVFHEHFPDMELHISTQAFATDINSVRLYKSLGASRVVLARELSLQEIKYIKENEEIELETFIHGAMCYSYSGQCLLSSCLGKRSGNRGRCAGPCRLPYTINKSKEEETAFFLSMKDQCTLMMIPKLIEAGIDSLKIEGRMKKPEYTAFVTGIYRKYINRYISNPSDYKVDKSDIEDLKHMYLRSEIGEGYYNRFNSRDMISLQSPAYLGNDDKLMDRVREKYISTPKKLPISIFATSEVGKKLSVTFMHEDKSVSVEGHTVLKADKCPLTQKDLAERLSKLGDFPFYADFVEVNIDGEGFVPVKEINELKRSAAVLLLELCSKKESAVSFNNNFRLKTHQKNVFEAKPIVAVYTAEQLTAAASFDWDFYIAVNHSLFSDESLLSIIKENRDRIFILMPHVFRKKDLSYFEDILNKSEKLGILGVYARNLSELFILNQKAYSGIIISGSFNYSWNKEAYNFIDGLCDALIQPIELSAYELKDINGNFYEFTYGKYPLMHSANCVINTSVGCQKNNGNSFAYIEDRMHVNFPIFRDCSVCENILFNSVPTSLHDEALLGKIDKNKALFVFTDESGKDVYKILDLFKNAFDQIKIEPDYSYTKGYRKRGVE